MHLSRFIDQSSSLRGLVARMLTDAGAVERPVLKPEEVSEAREWLSWLVCNAEALYAHIDHLGQLCGGSFRPSASRWDLPDWERPRPRREGSRFRFTELLPEEKAEAFARQGPDVLSDEEVAEVLVNPFALWDLADLVNFRESEWWWEAYRQVGEAMLARDSLEIPKTDDAESSTGSVRR